MDQHEIEAAVQERITRVAQAAEQDLVDHLRVIGAEQLWTTIREGLKASAFMESGVGKAYFENLSCDIARACNVWIESDDEAEVAAAKLSARAAMMAIKAFDALIAGGKEAQLQLNQIEQEYGR